MTQTDKIDDFPKLRARWRERIIGTPEYDSNDRDIALKIDQITNTARETWDMIKIHRDHSLWTDMTDDLKSSHITLSYRRIKILAIAYRTPGSSLYRDKSLSHDIIHALKWMHAHRYNETIERYGNWWDWEIGAPSALNDCLVLMYESLTDEQIQAYLRPVEKHSPVSNKTGANRVWKCKVVGIGGIVGNKMDKLNDSLEALAPLFTFTETIEDGYGRDGSFVQHNDHPYTIGYGSDLLFDIADLLYLYSATDWDIPRAYQEIILKWIKESYVPLIYRGAGMDMVRGREMARFFNQDHVAGHKVIRAIMRMMSVLPRERADELEAILSEWIESDSYLDFTANPEANLYDVIQAKSFSAREKNPAREPYRRYKQYPGMDRTVKHGKGFACAISMHSSRIANYEGDVNNENLRAWHTGDGMTYLYNGDLKQYSDNFWATVDPYRLPGTTVLSRNDSPSDRTNGKDWVGGTELDDRYGITGMDFSSVGKTLEARKTWFMSDDEIVALGADIKSCDDRTVETIIENRKISTAGDDTLTVDGTAQPREMGWKSTYDRVNWVHLKGKEDDSDVGYYFPGGTRLSLIRESRSGKWYDINRKEQYHTTETHQRNYLTMYVDHGINASASDSYAYLLLPGASREQIESYGNNSDITILRNDGEVQAVRKQSLNMIAANFWTDTTQTVGGITCSSKASVMVREQGDRLEVSLSDPTQKNEGVIELEIESSSSKEIVKVSVDVPGSRGRSVKRVIQL